MIEASLAEQHRLPRRRFLNVIGGVKPAFIPRIPSSRCLRSNNRSSYTEVPIECMVNMSVQRFKLGELLWCRINGGSWWPVQVVDENCVAFKPKRKKKDQILVRLYGTFEHMYVETTNCISKTEKIYDKENRSSREIFEKSLEEDLSRLKSGCPSEARVSEAIENVKEKDEASRGKGQRKGNLKRAMIEANSPLVDSSDKPKAAKKVKLVVRALKSGRRSETFEGGNTEKSGTEDAGEMQNLNNWASKIRSSDKKDSSCERISDAYTTEILAAKDIKRLVAKIVREVAAENARNEALEVKGMEKYPGKIEYVETSKKESYEMENLQLRIPRRVENRDTDIPVAGEQVYGAGTRRPDIPEEIDELSPRRTRIMQNLGLIAPSGSPFCRNGSNQSFPPLISRLD